MMKHVSLTSSREEYGALSAPLPPRGDARFWTRGIFDAKSSRVIKFSLLFLSFADNMF
jgi:hypothetical protein